MGSQTEYRTAVEYAQGVLRAHFLALNAGDETALVDTLHFPHYRLAGGRLQTWLVPDRYFENFRGRIPKDWHHSVIDSQDVIAASADKVHLDVTFTRYRRDGSPIGSYRSLWVVTCLEGRWAAQLRSSFAD